MNSTPRRLQCSVPLALSWTFAGATYRVAPWPDVAFERRYGAEWLPVEPSAEVLAGARLNPGAWRAYVEFVPADVRELLGLVRQHRLLALRIAARAPEIVGLLCETPALIAFVGCHSELRASAAARWEELAAVAERGGTFGLLEWLGLPATRQALSILTNLVSADLATHLVLPLRAALWRPQGILALAQRPYLTEQDLADACALAA